MTRTRLSIPTCLAMMMTACGPGRQAAWERQTAEAQKPQAAAEETAQAPAAEEEAPDAKAKEAWTGRSERASAAKAIAEWERLTKDGADDADTWTSLSRAYYFLADTHMRLAGEEETMIETFEKGVLAGERAMMAASADFAAKVQAGEKVEEAVKLIAQEGQPAIYWYATNLGKFAVAKGFTTTLFYKDRIYAVMQRVLDLDENFYYGAPHRYFGAFFAKAPSFAGGDMAKSKEHFERALKIDDRYLATKVLYAEYWAKKSEDKELFVRLLNEVKKGDADSLPGLLPEQKFEQEKAGRLLAQIDEIF